EEAARQPLDLLREGGVGSRWWGPLVADHVVHVGDRRRGRVVEVYGLHRRASRGDGAVSGRSGVAVQLDEHVDAVGARQLEEFAIAEAIDLAYGRGVWLIELPPGLPHTERAVHVEVGQHPV